MRSAFLALAALVASVAAQGVEIVTPAKGVVLNIGDDFIVQVEKSVSRWALFLLHKLTVVTCCAVAFPVAAKMRKQ